MIPPNLDDLVGNLCAELNPLEKEKKENEEKDDEMSKEKKGEQHAIDSLENFVTPTFQLYTPTPPEVNRNLAADFDEAALTHSAEKKKKLEEDIEFLIEHIHEFDANKINDQETEEAIPLGSSQELVPFQGQESV
ncbi:hypothetical protein LIER_04566 [Lithospermum erythrorhizon]|uniref:Uncharacterized protein n=1 Tax=Lithospermum erythrorhizon TaxID=34254 RepID=A0AAV3P1W5_LITER